jgi:type I restriction enzyme S subunit
MRKMKMQKNKDRPGYKKTKVGWIPDEWALVRAREVCTVITKGTTPRSRDHGKVAQPVPYLRVQNLSFDGTLLFEKDRLFVDKACHDSELSRSRLFPGDILINIVGPPLGKVSRVPALFPEWNMNQAVAVFRLGEGCEEVFLCHYLQTERARSWLDSQSKKTSGQKNLTLEACRALPIPLPSLPEQEAIAEVLQCWDRAIRYYENKIVKKRNVKKGLMQALLSGTIRLPGFGPARSELGIENSECGIPEGWKEVRLGQLGKVVSGGTPSTENPDCWNGAIPWCTPSEIASLRHKYIHSTERCITETGLRKSSAALLPEHSIIVCTRATIGECALNAIPMATNQGFKSIIVNKDHDAEFIYYKVLCMKKHFVRYACGSTFLEVSKRDFEESQMLMPGVEEQRAITAVLSAADAEVEALDRKLAVLKEQKRFLLNNLVTGSLRLPEFRIENGE